MKKKLLTTDDLEDLVIDATGIHTLQKYAGAASDYHARVPALYAPRITGTITKNGEQFYIDDAGKLYRPHLYDKMFAVEKGVIKDIRYKGENPNWRLVE